MKPFILKVLRRTPFLGPYLIACLRGRRFLTRYAPGHFYSPLLTPRWREDRIALAFSLVPGEDGIDYSIQRQIDLLRELGKFLPEYPFSGRPQGGLRYGHDNHFYPRGDGTYLYLMMRHFEPNRIIEVGSGHSSVLMMDVNERFFDGNIHLTFIEPNPGRLMAVMKEQEREGFCLKKSRVQDIGMDMFTQLEADDILFIDSSHVTKFGSDVNHLFFNVLPRLKSGVLIHIHDIPGGFEYPDEWLDDGRAWNEAYLVRAFLQYNSEFEILLHPGHLVQAHPERIKTLWDGQDPCGAYCLWLRRS